MAAATRAPGSRLGSGAASLGLRADIAGRSERGDHIGDVVYVPRNAVLWVMRAALRGAQNPWGADAKVSSSRNKSRGQASYGV